MASCSKSVPWKAYLVMECSGCSDPSCPFGADSLGQHSVEDICSKASVLDTWEMQRKHGEAGLIMVQPSGVRTVPPSTEARPGSRIQISFAYSWSSSEEVVMAMEVHGLSS